jgi:hypothetical protein
VAIKITEPSLRKRVGGWEKCSQNIIKYKQKHKKRSVEDIREGGEGLRVNEKRRKLLISSIFKRKL